MPLIPYLKQKLVGYCDSDKKMVIAPQFECAMPFAADYAWVKNQGKWGTINQDGTYRTEPKYDFPVFPIDAYWHTSTKGVRIGKKWGLVIDGYEVLPAMYDYEPQKCDKESWWVSLKKKVGRVNLQHEVVQAFAKSDTYHLDDANIMYGEGWTINKERRVRHAKNQTSFLLPSEFDEVYFYIPSKSLFCCNKMVGETMFCGFVNTNGEVVLPSIYQYVDAFHESTEYFYFTASDKTGVLSSTFEVLIPATYDLIQYYKDDLFACSSQAQICFVNARNEQVPPMHMPSTARINWINLEANFIQYIDHQQFVFADLDGTAFFSMPIASIIDADRLTYMNMLTYKYAKCNGKYYLNLPCTDQSYLIDFSTRLAKPLGLSIYRMWLHSESHATIELYGGTPFSLFNIKTGKIEDPMQVISTRANYLVTRHGLETGSLDMQGNVMLPPRKIGYFVGIEYQNLELFSNTADPKPDSRYYWIDMLRDIVYAEDLPLGKEPQTVQIEGLADTTHDLEAGTLPYFEQFDPGKPEESYYHDLAYKGNTVKMGLTTCKVAIDHQQLLVMRNALEKLPEIDALLIRHMQKDFKAKGVVWEYIDHFLREVSPENVKLTLKNCDPKLSKAKQCFSLLRLKCFSIRLDSLDRFIWVDYTINLPDFECTNYVMTASFNASGVMTDYTRES
jgi:WG containing repeat/Protein of unknown function (DUF2004)